MIAAIDPGSEKTGVAIVEENGSLVEKKIIPTGTLADWLQHLYENYHFTDVVMGDGTNHKHLQPVAEKWIQEHAGGVTFSLIDEKFTTVEGRKLYFQYTPRRGWRKYIPVFWQYPPEPVDDFVAWIIGLRYIKQRGGAR